MDGYLTMVEMGSISALVGSLSAVKDIAQGLLEARDTTAFASKLSEIQGRLIDANNAAFQAQEERAALLERIRDLEKQVIGLETWTAEKQRYVLAKVGDRSTFAYALKGGVEPPEEPHHLCANCFNENHKAILQQEIRAIGTTDILKCHRCDSEIVMHGLVED